MKKTVQSTIKPEPVVIDDYNAWLASNVREIIQTDEEGKEYTEFEYELTQVPKDEYILQLHNELQQSKLESDLAIADLAEVILGGDK